MKSIPFVLLLSLFLGACNQADNQSAAKDVDMNNQDGMIGWTSGHTYYKAMGFDAEGAQVDPETAVSHCWYYKNTTKNIKGRFTSYAIAKTVYPAEDDSSDPKWAKYNTMNNSISGSCGAIGAKGKSAISKNLNDGGKSKLSFDYGEDIETCWYTILDSLKRESTFLQYKIKCPDMSAVIFDK